ncbi:hypothetical protein H6G97_28330 [Nostoc flagelliforme FACHB-838]|uniref:Uncharacterized protein n=1 Tax=Nostoc flagelliforme FACHB-838 TaxID=2692904 RepID=A0ABR8DVS8_9NOSO|nr:hypothetical protein [Nostoc flagelliforme]MBD2533268.1 hypothetical protein [Nostoc flagelliforme FACHB-838]
MPLKRSLLRESQRNLLLQANHSFFVAQTSNGSSSNNPDFWRDPAWQSIGVIVAILLTLLTIFIGWKQAQKKSFSYSISSKVNVLDIEDSIKSKIQVTFDSKPVKDLYLIIIKFVNSGNTPIQSNDYYQPVTIVFNRSAEILSVEILEQSPNNLGVVPVYTSQNIEIPKILLNQKDCFDLKVLVTNFQDLSVNGRIAGVKEIQEKDSSNLEAYNKVVIALTAIVITALSGFLINFLLVQNVSFFSKSGELITTVFVAILVTFLPAGVEVLTNLKKRK